MRRRSTVVLLVAVLVVPPVAATVSAPPAVALSSPNSNSADIDIAYVDTNNNLKYIDAGGNTVDTGVNAKRVRGIADIDSDGDLDIAYKSTGSTLKYVDTNGNIFSTGKTVSDVGGIADIDGDGDLDVTFTDTNDNLKYIDAGGNTVNTAANALNVGGIADIDGDGDLDIAFRDTNNNLKYIDAGGNTVNTGANAKRAGGIADIDGDGDLDITFRDTNDNLKYIDAGGNTVNTGANAFNVGGIADIDSDGDLDIAFRGTNFNVKYVDVGGNIVNTGKGSLSIGGVADIDGDGFFTAAPSVDNSSATPDGGTVTSGSVSLSIPVSDPELDDGDRVTATVTLNGQQVGSKTITSNKTISVSATPQDGTNSWSVTATDRTGNSVTSQTFSFTGDFAMPEGTPSPTGNITGYDGDIELAVSDPDFSLAAGDNVTVEAVNASGGQIGQTTVSSNQTVSFQYGALAGKNDITWTLTDEYGNSETVSQTFTTPANLSIYNASDPDQLITGTQNEITVRFFGEDDVIVERTTTDGNVSLAGLPVAPEQEYQVTVQPAGTEYFGRTVVIRSLFDQQQVFLLPTNATSSTVEFRLTDRTGRFQQPFFTIERPITRDFDGDGKNETRYKAAVSQEFSAAQSLTVDLEQGIRYRLRVRNANGAERVLGSYTPRTTTDVVELTIAQIKLATGERNQGVATNAKLVEQNGGRFVRALFDDPDKKTSELNISVKRVDVDPNTTVTTDTALNLGRTVQTYNVSSYPENATFAVVFEATRGGTTFTRVVRVGNLPPWRQGLSPLVASLVAWVSLVSVTGLVVIRAPRVGAVVAVVLATAFSTLGFINVGPVPLGIAGATAVLFVVSRGVGQ